MAKDEKPTEAAHAAKPRDLEDFLESSPPGAEEEVAINFGQAEPTGSGWIYKLGRPDLQLYCDDDDCQGLRFFRTIDKDIYLHEKSDKNLFLTYSCRNCRATQKLYAVTICRVDNDRGRVIKHGEYPPFGPPTPARVISLIGPDRDTFLAGRRAENHGFGIGAFAYYRRVVENQKGRIIQEIAKASAKLGASPEMLAELKQVEKETQFSKAIDQIKIGIPAALMIDGHNPLTLLHTALSEGLHDQKDEECLQIAQEIRLVLTELAERISQALKEEAELKQAVSRLMGRKKPTK
jgi:predicted nucleic acid-binding protein